MTELVMQYYGWVIAAAVMVGALRIVKLAYPK